MTASMKCCVDVKQWRDALTDAVELSVTTRGVLFVMTRWMNKDGSNCYPGRARIAAYCGLSERQVDRELAAAVAAGYLHLVAPGRRGQNAVYAATIPTDRVGDKNKITPRKVDVSATLAARYQERKARHGRRANSEIARQELADSATQEVEKRDAGGAPTSASTTSEELPPSEVFRLLPRAALAAEEKRSEEVDFEEVDAYAWITSQFDHLDLTDESTIDGMLSRGAHPRAIVAAIRKRQQNTDELEDERIHQALRELDEQVTGPLADEAAERLGLETAVNLTDEDRRRLRRTMYEIHTAWLSTDPWVVTGTETR